MDAGKSICPVCFGACFLFDVVDFNKSCAAEQLPLSGIPIYYVRCAACGFCFAPECHALSPEEFTTHIYNNEYLAVDPEYLEIRPRKNAATLLAMFPDLPGFVRHLDYGGGNGLLAQALRESNWNSVSFDPLLDKAPGIGSLGKYDLITAFEVFEHVPDVHELMSNLRRLLSPGGLVLFSTLLSDGNIQPNKRLTWWYASPRNGHISLFSRKSLDILVRTSEADWRFGSFSEGFHAIHTSSPPSWAKHLIRTE
jgi:SAM-dependent methyltransferase